MPGIVANIPFANSNSGTLNGLGPNPHTTLIAVCLVVFHSPQSPMDSYSAHFPFHKARSAPALMTLAVTTGLSCCRVCHFNSPALEQSAEKPLQAVLHFALPSSGPIGTLNTNAALGRDGTCTSARPPSTCSAEGPQGTSSTGLVRELPGRGGPGHHARDLECGMERGLFVFVCIGVHRSPAAQ